MGERPCWIMFQRQAKGLGLVRLGCCLTPYQRLRLYNGAPFSRLLRHVGDTEDVGGVDLRNIEYDG